jgi:hypothetical protein
VTINTYIYNFVSLVFEKFSEREMVNKIGRGGRGGRGEEGVERKGGGGGIILTPHAGCLSLPRALLLLARAGFIAKNG